MEYSGLVLGYSAYVLATVGTPGPNNIMITASGANFGIKRSVPHIFGIGLGFIFMQVLVGLGLGQVFTVYPMIHDVLRYVGAAFLLYLAYKIATSKNNLGKGETAKTPMTFMQAAAFQWVNPKAWVMVIGAIASFISVDGQKFVELGIMIIVNLLVSIPLIFGWCLFGLAIGKILKTDFAFKMFNYAMAGLLVLTIITLFT